LHEIVNNSTMQLQHKTSRHLCILSPNTCCCLGNSKNFSDDDDDDDVIETSAINSTQYSGACHTVWHQIFTGAGFQSQTALFLCWKLTQTAFSDWLIINLICLHSVLPLFGILESEDRLGI